MIGSHICVAHPSIYYAFHSVSDLHEWHCAGVIAVIAGAQTLRQGFCSTRSEVQVTPLGLTNGWSFLRNCPHRVTVMPPLLSCLDFFDHETSRQVMGHPMLFGWKADLQEVASILLIKTHPSGYPDVRTLIPKDKLDYVTDDDDGPDELCGAPRPPRRTEKGMLKVVMHSMPSVPSLPSMVGVFCTWGAPG